MTPSATILRSIESWKLRQFISYNLFLNTGPNYAEPVFYVLRFQQSELFCLYNVPNLNETLCYK